MRCTYQYQGFSIEVGVEMNVNQGATIDFDACAGYVATVRVLYPGLSVAVFSPLRFGETPGRLFSSEADALTGGCGAGQRLVDDLCDYRGQA